MVEETTLKDWFQIKKMRDDQISEWAKGVKIGVCSGCGQAYSYGYEPVLEDPGMCQGCRGAEGELIYGG